MNFIMTCLINCSYSIIYYYTFWYADLDYNRVDADQILSELIMAKWNNVL